MECPIYSYNAGAPKIDTVLDALMGWGFVANGMHEVHTRFGILFQVDILFIKRSLLAEIEPRALEFYKFL